MTELIARELHETGIMFFCGIAIMLVFTARDALRKRCGTHRRAAQAIYFCGWLCAGYLFTEFLYVGSHGVISLYGIMAMGGGILLWKKVVYGIMNAND
ncbi:spore cortex biosynthesis protein YabQ [Ihubacter sp. rT4E-8]|uniref:spore cortex biosynthesis protein YabQ n=1 Tax=unclassified Ihubacter TaxID=2633299 RepID=UPI00137964F3